MVIKKDGNYSVVKDGSFYRVLRKRTRVGSFKLLSQAIEYMEIKLQED